MKSPNNLTTIVHIRSTDILPMQNEPKFIANHQRNGSLHKVSPEMAKLTKTNDTKYKCNEITFPNNDQAIGLYVYNTNQLYGKWEIYSVNMVNRGYGCMIMQQINQESKIDGQVIRRIYDTNDNKNTLPILTYETKLLADWTHLIYIQFYKIDHTKSDDNKIVYVDPSRKWEITLRSI